ncbi:MAG: hypothetical protein CSYNP_03342 [Syntrophus sp. SKADARSKE-3]|nr:hypothetical protein [Syntrophus sp. SKADARSKE-3]
MPVKILYDIYQTYLMPDKAFIKRSFKSGFGYELNLDRPKTLNEKIQWLKLNHRTPLHTICADKYAVREYVKEKIGEEHLIPLAFHTRNPANIIPDNLPDYPFIIKTNHDNSGHIVVKDKSTIDWKSVQETLKKKLKRNYYYPGREWQYKDIEPYIIVEKLLMDEKGNIPNDYKLHCFNGRVAFIQVDLDRSIDHKRNLYDVDWNFMDCVWIFNNGSALERPCLLPKMLSLAEIPAKDFHYVRVDLYNIGSAIYVGELTFSPGGGFEVFSPPEWDVKLGNMLILPIDD